MDFGPSSGTFRDLNGPENNQSFRWTGQVYLASAGVYTFAINTLSAQRLTINGTVVVDDFTNPSKTQQQGTYAATSPGWVSLKLEVVSYSGPSEAYLYWATPGNQTLRLLRAEETAVGGVAQQVLRYSSAAMSRGLDDDFHLSSTAGSYHGGQWLSDAVDSPLIDAGDLSSPYNLEPGANGNRINLGFEGDTPQASKSHSILVQLLSFTGDQKVLQGQPSVIQWRTIGFQAGDLLTIQFSSDNGATFTTLGTPSANAGTFAWTPTVVTLLGLIRLSSPNHAGVSDVSHTTFVVGHATNAFYVNDNSLVGNQYTTALGNNANSGATPGDPMASLNAVLAVYKPGAGDTVYVDSGVYNLPTNVEITAADSGVVIVGPTSGANLGPGYQAVTLSDSPLAYYQFGEAAGSATAVDSSGHRLDATYVGGVALGSAGAVLGDKNTAASLDGSTGYVQLPAGFSNCSNGITLEAWVYPTALNSSPHLFDLGNGAASDNIVLEENGPNGGLRLQVYNGSSPGNSVTSSGGALALNQWQFIAVTIGRDGSAVIYKNGRPISSGTIEAPDSVLRADNYVGKSNWPTDATFAGGLDEAAVFLTALAPEQIATQYYTAVSQGAILSRGNTGTNRDAIELNGANNVTISNLQLAGANQGFSASNATGITLAKNVAFNNATCGFYVDSTVQNAVLTGNIAYGTTGDTNTEQDTDFHLRGGNLTVDGNTAYRIGSQFGSGIFIDDSVSTVTLSHNLVYNNSDGVTAYVSQAAIFGNEVRNNERGMLVSAYDNSQRTLIYQNNVHDNGTGLVLESNTEAYGNTSAANTGAGIYLDDHAGDNTWVHGNYSVNNGTGIEAETGRIYQNRVAGNSGDGLLLDSGSVYASGNIVYGSSVGIEVDGEGAGGTQLADNLVYQNAHQAIYVHDVQRTDPVSIINNTVDHDTGSAVRIENNAVAVRLYNNIIVIGGGLGVELIGDANGFDSDYNDIFPAHSGAAVGKYQDQNAANTLAAWQAASGGDAHSVSADPLFIAPSGADHLLGWAQPDARSHFADYGRDDNFHLGAHSPAIDSANSNVAPSVDAEGNAPFDNMGAFEFTGSSSDVVPPVVTGITPVGATGNNLSNARFSSLTIHFSKPLDPISAQSPALYSLVEAGPDGVLGTADDVSVAIAGISYVPGSQDVTLSFGSQLPTGLYRLTLISGPTGAIVDLSGNALDGDGNGVAGGNFVRDFRLDLTAPVVGSVNPAGSVSVGPTKLTVSFQEDLQMNAGTVANPANYGLISTTQDALGNTQDVDVSARITGVSYDPASMTATLTLSGPLPAGRYRLIVRSTITDQAGNPLDNGVNYSTSLGVGAPALSPISGLSVYAGTPLTFTAAATDPNSAAALNFGLGLGAPGGARMTTGGVFTWTPTAAQAGSDYNIRILVSDHNNPALTDAETVAITVLANPAPVVQSVVVNDGSAQRSWIKSLTLQFSDNVSASLSLASLSLVNLMTNTTIAASSMNLSYATTSNQAVLTFPGLPGQKLPDGNYRLTVLAAGVTGPHGTHLAADYTFDCFVLTGDVNGDGKVNADDLALVWAELSKPPAARNLDYDLNGDGQVTAADLAVIKSHYLATQPLPPALILATTVNDGQMQRSRVFDIILQFSEDVSASLSVSDLALTNLDTHAAVTGFSVAFDASTCQATVTFPGLSNQQVPDGNYELVVKGAGVANSQGQPMAGDYHLRFFALTGDVNGDRVVNNADLMLMWQQLQKPAADRDLNFDVNGDGQVTAADLAVVKAHYLASLPAAPGLGLDLTPGSVQAGLGPASQTTSQANGLCLRGGGLWRAPGLKAAPLPTMDVAGPQPCGGGAWTDDSLAPSPMAAAEAQAPEDILGGKLWVDWIQKQRHAL